MEVDGMPVADDETVQFRDDERLEWTHVVHCKHIGDELRLLILRDGQELEVRYLLQAKKPLVPILHGVDCIPSYYTMGGLVFMPLSLPLLENAFGARKWRNVVPAAVLAAFNLSRAREEQQVGGWRGCVCAEVAVWWLAAGLWRVCCALRVWLPCAGTWHHCHCCSAAPHHQLPRSLLRCLASWHCPGLHGLRSLSSSHPVIHCC